jgi:hypothetical protein
MGFVFKNSSAEYQSNSSDCRQSNAPKNNPQFSRNGIRLSRDRDKYVATLDRQPYQNAYWL